MVQPLELKTKLPVKLSNDVMSTTTKLWEILVASCKGDRDKVKSLVNECHELVYGQYNYTPPIHFAVREGHTELVKYLLDQGALDPAYKTYPFLDSLITIAEERSYTAIATLLREYEADPERHKFKGDNGEIMYERTKEQQEFQRAVNHNELNKVASILKEHPEFAKDETMSWGEGILMMPANRKNKNLLELLLNHGAKVPCISKWGRAYYFKHYDIAKFLLENGMNANHITWHHVSLLHDMAQEGNLPKAKLLIDHGADIDVIEEEYKSTPLGLAARWGQTEMVQYLIEQGADRNKSAANWSRPVEWARSRGHTKIEKLLAT
jgi:ankyrin repeat protein